MPTPVRGTHPAIHNGHVTTAWRHKHAHTGGAHLVRRSPDVREQRIDQQDSRDRGCIPTPHYPVVGSRRAGSVITCHRR
jgi:hypothetical protein